MDKRYVYLDLSRANNRQVIVDVGNNDGGYRIAGPDFVRELFWRYRVDADELIKQINQHAFDAKNNPAPQLTECSRCRELFEVKGYPYIPQTKPEEDRTTEIVINCKDLTW